MYDDGAPEVTDGSDVPINLKNNEPILKFDNELDGPTYRDFDDENDFEANVGNLKSSGGYGPGKNYNRYDERDTPVLSSNNKRNVPMPNINKLKTESGRKPDQNPINKINANVNMNTKLKAP